MQTEKYIGGYTTAFKIIPRESNALIGICSAVWLGGVIAVITFEALSYIILKRKLRFSIKYKDNIYTNDKISISFVFGIIKPKIYIPENADNFYFISVHENMHIQRLDYIIKPIACIILAFHWFNPLCYILLKWFSDDTELCCDEDVLSYIGIKHNAEYAKSLYQNAVKPSKNIIYCFTASFSKNITKKRIKNILDAQPQKRSMCGFSVMACIILTAVFCTNASAVKKAADIILPVRETFSETVSEKVQNAEEPIAEDVSVSIPQKSQKDTDMPEPEESIVLPEESSYSLGCKSTAVTPLGDGSVTISFDINTECLMNVTITETETGIAADEAVVMAGKNSQTFYGLDPCKLYDISLSAAVKSDWIIEGTYKIN